MKTWSNYKPTARRVGERWRRCRKVEFEGAMNIRPKIPNPTKEEEEYNFLGNQ